MTSIWNDSEECHVVGVKTLVISRYSLGLVVLISCPYIYCFCAQDYAFICRLFLRNILDDYLLPCDAPWTCIVSKAWHTHPTIRVCSVGWVTKTRQVSRKSNLHLIQPRDQHYKIFQKYLAVVFDSRNHIPLRFISV